MPNKRKNIIIVVIVLLTIAISYIIAALILSKKASKTDDGTAFDELFVREVLEDLTVDDIINDPQWGENLADSTDNYIMVSAEKFDYLKHTGMNNGYSMLYFDSETKDIHMIQHSFVSFVENESPKTAVETIVSNVQGELTELLGNPEQKFMLMNTSGEFNDYKGLSVDEMIDKLLVDETVMYSLFKHNGIKYEINIMYSDETIYMMTWVYEENMVNNS